MIARNKQPLHAGSGTSYGPVGSKLRESDPCSRFLPYVFARSGLPPLRSRAQRWHDAVAVLVALQAQYAGWLEAMPDSLQGSTTAEALRAIVDLDLSELQAIELPKGFGRD